MKNLSLTEKISFKKFKKEILQILLFLLRGAGLRVDLLHVLHMGGGEVPSSPKTRMHDVTPAVEHGHALHTSLDFSCRIEWWKQS